MSECSFADGRLRFSASKRREEHSQAGSIEFVTGYPDHRLVRGHGCTEMASDTWIDHLDSQRAHEALGFEEVERSVNYRKRL